MDHNSFFIMGLEFLMGNSENIKRQNDINAGIYTAKAVKGLWIQGGRAPFGYKKEGKNEVSRLIVDESEAFVVRYIYDAYIAGVALYKKKEKAIEMELKRTATTAVERILTNPLYYGFQQFKAWKQNPGGLFPLKNHEPIYLSDLNYVYTEANTIEKQELIKMVFDDFLY
ncbi:recombinase family protein [Sphingobacterium sp. Mn56C]|uniref:recombinase family protein n=1 Tax=Sphingobacterium sp. Mn56C TaxID=3395261 RepID=UPI003BD9E133